jgi:hypothetical protein
MFSNSVGISGDHSFRGLMTLLYQLKLSPVQDPHQEQVLARLEIDLEVLLLDSIAYRE